MIGQNDVKMPVNAGAAFIQPYFDLVAGFIRTGFYGRKRLKKIGCHLQIT